MKNEATLGQWTVPPIRVNDDELGMNARALQKLAARHHDSFIKDGIPKRLLKDFAAAIAAVDDTMQAHAGQVAEQLNATLSAVAHMQAGRLYLKALTSFVVARLRGERPDLVAAWKGTIRIQENPGTSRGGSRGRRERVGKDLSPWTRA